MKHTYSVIIFLGLSTSSLFSMSYLQCINWKQFLAPCAVVVAWELGKRGYRYVFPGTRSITHDYLEKFYQEQVVVPHAAMTKQLQDFQEIRNKTQELHNEHMEEVRQALGLCSQQILHLYDWIVGKQVAFQKTEATHSLLHRLRELDKKSTNLETTLQREREVQVERDAEREKKITDLRKALQNYQSDVFKALGKQSRIATNRTDSAWICNRFTQVEDRLKLIEQPR